MKDYERGYITDRLGDWTESKDGGVIFKMFEMYKVFGYNYIVTEKGQYRMVGKLEKCLDYIDEWI